ncbi:MAG: TonB-dependent receptor [Blastocatellia bacterium]|nr:MAG: TonB-dependent receptor [Blastocatellia bacterium]
MAGSYELTFSLINFSKARKTVAIGAVESVVNAVLPLALSADITVTGKATFTNLADAENPAQNLVGIAQSASQGAITAKQLNERPLLRTGEALETVPGVVVSQHSGEGKANQYYLRGFNLDHGTDFATTIAGMPVNMPTHAHGQGYSDLNFLIPELVSGVQFSKGPYFADQGDFATAGAANINYTSTLDRPIVHVGGGGEGFGRAFIGVSPAVGSGHMLVALELEHNDGPWAQPDNYRKVNGVLRYSHGTTLNGFSVTGMGYRARWNASDQIPERAVAKGEVARFGTLDPTDGGDTYRYAGSVEWQRTSRNAATSLVAYGIAYGLDLFSNFTFFLNDPIRGDQFHQQDGRVVSGARLSHRRLERWGSLAVQNTTGVQLRNDDIYALGLDHTQSRQFLSTIRKDAVLQTSGAVYAQNEIQWTPWVRTLAGIRADAYRLRVDTGVPANAGVAHPGLASPKGGIIIGPFRGTEFYANAGLGFHSNDARVTINLDPSTPPEQANRVTPLVRAKGAEAGVRTIAVPHLQTSMALWSLDLDSELVFLGDAGTTEAGRPSRRYGVELASYYTPRPWMTFDFDVSMSRAHFSNADPAGAHIPGSVETVVSGGATFESFHNLFGSVRLRYFGPRPLIEDNSIRSEATTLVNLEGGYRLAKDVKIRLDVFNVLNVRNSDIDYYYASRLPGEPAGGVNDIHFHPTLARNARISLVFGF